MSDYWGDPSVTGDFTPEDSSQGKVSLWQGDAGELQDSSRRALVQLLRGPYLSAHEMPRLWTALVADEDLIRSRLHDLFLDLELDKVNEFAFTRSINIPDVDIPRTLRTERMAFIDTAMLLLLRQHLLASPTQDNVFVDKDELLEALDPYRQTDEPTFKRSVNAAWGRMANKYRLIHVSSGSERARISPMVRFLVDADRVDQLTALYKQIAAQNEDAKGGPDE